MILSNLAHLWQAGQDPKLPAAVGAVLQMPVEQVRELLISNQPGFKPKMRKWLTQWLLKILKPLRK